MRTLFTTIFLPILFFGLFLNGKVLGQTGKIIHGTVKSSDLIPEHYYPMPTGFNTEDYEELSYIKEDEGSFMNMRILFPEDYDSSANDGKQYPLLLMLHGAGESGIEWSNHFNYESGYKDTPPEPEKIHNNDHQLLWGGVEHLNAVRHRDPSDVRHFPGLVLFPQTGRNGSWTGAQNEVVIEILEILIDSLKIDPERIYVWGLSNGAVGTWDIINRRPDLFAAAMAMSGVFNSTFENYNSLPETLAHKPIWLFQGGQDTNPSPNYAEQSLDKLIDVGGTPKYTLYEDLGHGTWQRAYKRPDFYTWFLDHTILSIHAFYGKTDICAGQELDIKLGIAPGHLQYQWSLDGTIIPDANSYNYEPSEFGEYRVRVIRQGETEWTEWSEPIEVKISDPYIPEVITQSTTKPSLDGEPTVTLSHPGEFSKIYWYLSYDDPDGPMSWQEAGRDRTRIFSGNSDAVWRAQVTQLNGCVSEYSDTIVVTVGAPTNIITAPGPLSTMPISETRINLLWEDNSNDERGFEIYRTKDTDPYASDADYTFVTKTEPNETFYVDKGLEANTTYYYRMRAVNWQGSSPYTDAIMGQTFEDLEAPTRPRSLTALPNIDLESITLSWESATDNIAVASYNVYEVQADNSLIFKGTTTETTFVVEGLQESTRYTYVVKATDNSNNLSAASNQVSAVTEICGLQYTLYSGSWGSVSEFTPEQIVTTGMTDNFDIGVRSGVGNDKFGFEFRGRIRIYNAGNYTFFTESDDGSYLWVDGIAVVDENDGDHPTVEKSGNIYLTAGSHTIKVRYYENGGGENLSVKYQGPEIAKQLIPNDVLCGTYAPETPPATPSDLIASETVSNQIDISWSDNSTNEYGFELYRSEAQEGPFTLISTTEVDAVNYQDTGLAAGFTYYYKVRAIGATGQSAFSNVDYAATPEDNERPTSVLNLQVVNNSDRNALLSWTASTDNIGVEGYNIYQIKENEELELLAETDDLGDLVARNTQANGEMSLLSETEESTMYFLLKGLTSATTYDLVVKAFDAAGLESLGNDQVSFTTSGNAPLPIDLISFSGKAKNSSIRLDWKTASEQDNDYFTIERADNGTDFMEIATVEGAGTSAVEREYSFTDYDPIVGTMFYRLKQTDFNGDFEYSNIISVQFPSVTSAIDNALKNLVLYPNPTSSENINLKLEGVYTGGMANIKIVDMIGRTHLAYSFETKALSKGLKVHTDRRLTPGLYIVIIEQANKVTKLKLIINE